MPLTASGVPRVLVSSVLAAAFASGLWLGLAQAWIAVLGLTAAFAPAADRYAQQLPFLFAIGVLLFLLSLAVHYVLLAFEAARQAERRQLELEILTRDAELRALRAQIDPHFLYNSLNSISALTGSDAPGARRMCLLLGEFLRNTLDVSARQRIPLADELALAERYLNIEQVRFGSRLQVERRVDDDASACLVPPLLLQPLVENAVTHGIARLLEGGLIRLDVVAAERPAGDRDRESVRRRRGRRAAGRDGAGQRPRAGWTRCSAATRAWMRTSERDGFASSCCCPPASIQTPSKTLKGDAFRCA